MSWLGKRAKSIFIFLFFFFSFWTYYTRYGYYFLSFNHHNLPSSDHNGCWGAYYTKLLLVILSLLTFSLYYWSFFGRALLFFITLLSNYCSRWQLPLDLVEALHLCAFLVLDCGLANYVINFIWTYLHQFFDNSHSLNGYGKPLKKPFNQYQLCLKKINIGQDIRQISR